MHLLQDDNGVKVDVINRNHIDEGTEAITWIILQKWLTNGGPTCTYQHLMDCLRDSGLIALADEMSEQLEAHERVSHCIHCSLCSAYSVVSTAQ